jgi:uncharacterized protein
MAEDRQVQLFASLDMLDEIHRVLECEKILRILKRSGKEPSSIMATIVSLCSLIDVRSRAEVIRDDPADNRILACAKDAAADFIVSGDHHLLKLEQYENARVLTAASFVESQQHTKTK